MEPNQTVFGIFGVPDAGEALVALAAWSGLTGEVYGSVPEYLSKSDPTRPGCLVLDLAVANDVALLRAVAAHACNRPIILIVGRGRQVTGVSEDLFFDVIEKPFQPQILLDCILRATGCDLEVRI